MAESGTTPTNAATIIAACIITAGLIGAALIAAPRPAATVGATARPDVPPRTTAPPIAQESVRAQFRAQALAAPALHAFSSGGATHAAADVKVNQIIYTAKDDTFTLVYDWVLQPAMPNTSPQSGVSTFSNDGYGHYYGSAVVGPSYAQIASADVTLR